MKTDASLSLTIQTLRRKWEEKPTHPLVFQLVDEYRRIERFDLAAEVLQKQVESYPQHFSARVALGRCRLELGEPRLAADVIEPVVAVDPTHLIANKLLVKAYLQLGEATKARDRLDLYVLLNDDDWEIDELERQLRELDDGQASVLPEAQQDGSTEVSSSIEKIEQELLNPSTPESLAAGGGGAQLNEPPELEENDRDSDPSEAGKEEPSSDQMQGAVGSDEVELSQEQEHPEISHPSEASDSSEAVGSSSQLVVEKPREPPSDTPRHPIEESSRDTSSQSSAQVEPEAPGAPREEQPETAPDATPKATPAELQGEATVSPSETGFKEASTSTSGGSDPKSSVPAPPVLPKGIEAPFQVDSSRLKSASLKRLLAAGGIFSIESPGRGFITGK